MALPAAMNGSAALHHGSEGAALRMRRTEVEVDRDRIARDLHDTVVQRLFATGLTLHNALRFVGANSEVTDRIEQAIEELDRVVREVRITVFELHAAPGLDGGISRKLLRLGDELSNALGFRPSFQFEGPIDTFVTDTIAPHLLAAVGEALANLARHQRPERSTGATSAPRSMRRCRSPRCSSSKTIR